MNIIKNLAFNRGDLIMAIGMFAGLSTQLYLKKHTKFLKLHY